METETAGLRERLQAALGAAYTLERELGGGGMSRVFLATDARLGRRVVVKILHPDLAAGLSAQRFEREIRLAARLQHPHVVALLSAGDLDGLPYYTMPYVEGESLRQRLAREGALDAAVAVRLLRELADALAYAHAQGVVHRDVKPENILLSGGHAVVADFGVAKALASATRLGTGTEGASAGATGTALGMAVGTPAYMAPEQAVGDPMTDHRADLYAFGVVAYEVLSGRPPFAGRAPQALIAAHLIEPPEPITQRCPAIPAALASLVMRCLEKSPEDRPRTAEDILRALGSASLTASAATDRRPSVAVLPMVNLSGAEENDHFSDGLTDELIGALGQVAELTVSGRTSVFALRGKDLGVRAIADTLNVAHVLEGSVRRAGHRLKVRVQLVDADGKILWSEAYDRTLTDVFAVQEEIAQAVVRALEIRLGTARGPLVRPPTTDLTAYDLYLKGRYVRRRFNADDLSRAIGYFEQAVALDPAYARAHAALSDAHTLLAVFGGRPALQQLPVARTYAQRAVELDGMLADAHWALAHVSFALELDLPAAGREFRRALELDPGHGDARHMYAIWLLDFRRFEEAAGETTRALAADPLLAEASMTLGRVYTAMGRADRAIPYLLDALELSPGFTYAREQLAHAYLQLGRHDAAVAECERAASVGGGREAAVLAYTYAVAGRGPEASAMVRELTSGDGYAPPCHVAMAFAGLGDADAALTWLERAFAEHDPHLTGLAILPAFEPLRADPRFATLVSRLGVEP